MTFDIFQYWVLGLQAISAASTIAVAVMIFKAGVWKGHVDDAIKRNDEDHKRYEAVLVPRSTGGD